MEIRILGPLSVITGDAREVPLGGPKPRTVLAALLLAGESVLSDAHLARLLWNGHAPVTAQAQLYTYVSRLRNALAPHMQLLRRRPGYRIRTGAARVDADEFARLAGIGRAELKRGKPVDALRHLDAAHALWRGPALADVAEPLRLAESTRLEELRMAALEDRIDAKLALDAPARVLPELAGLVTRYPMRERLRAQLMLALFRDERQADALDVYHEGRALLDQRVGVAPGPLLRETYQWILTGGDRLAPGTTASGNRRPAVPGCGTATTARGRRPSLAGAAD
jgi:DNA-binding SARP family transcriptional activator